jgi:Fic family protein
MGRLLITLLLIERNVLPSPLLYLSAFFEATRDDYYRQLNNVSTKGTWDEWLEYFLNGVAVQSSDVLSRAARINQLISNWLIDVAGTSSNLPAKIVEYLAVNPFLTTNKVASYFGIAFTTAQRAIQKLETAEVLSQVGNAKRDKLYCAKKILEILEEPAQINEGLK